MAVILYTSGTTGNPKGVVLTHGNLLANLEQVLRVLYINEGDRFFSVLPLHHSFEATCGFLFPMTEGAMITFPRSLKSKELLEDLKDTRPTVFLVVPLLLEKLHQGLMKNLQKASPVRRGVFHGLKTLARACDLLLKGSVSRGLLHRVRAAMGLDRLRYLVSGGAALPRNLSKEYEMLGFPIMQGYGLTEAAPVISVNLPNKCRNESTGPPLPGIEAKIINPDQDGIGEIAVKGSNVMQGYYRNEEATREVLRDGWLYTGDLGRIDGEGFLYVTGRKKSLIVTRGGKNISPEEIEEELLMTPFIKETLVLAKIHPRTKNEEIHAIIYPDFDRMDEYAREKGITTDEEGIRELIRQHVEKVNSALAHYKRIRNFSIRQEEFPKTTTEKIKRYLFEEGGMEVK
jgi:long-chain acyl-CoA synthetase